MTPSTTGAGVRSVVVTGAARGIGAAIAERLTAADWVVVGVDRDRVRLEALMSSLAGPSVVGDVRDPAVMSCARRTAEQSGELRAWVNNAGIVRVEPLHLMAIETITEVLDIDLVAVVLGTREALRSFLSHGVAGSVVNISSIHSRAAFPGFGAYDAAKGGVEALTRHVCVEYGHLGIRCNAVAPGAVRTEIATAALASRGAAHEGQRSSARSGGVLPDPSQLAPMRRQSEPTEIASAVAFLLDEVSFSINGHVLAVDNGMSSWSFAFPPDPDVHFQG